MASTLAVGTSAGSLSEISPEPDTFGWGLQDISASDAGRTQDAGNTMHKNRTSQKRKISLGWTNPTMAQASAILRAFNPEYVYVRYPDPMEGGWAVRKFYVGDRSSQFMQVSLTGTGARSTMSSISFDIIEV